MAYTLILIKFIEISVISIHKKCCFNYTHKSALSFYSVSTNYSILSHFLCCGVIYEKLKVLYGIYVIVLLDACRRSRCERLLMKTT